MLESSDLFKPLFSKYWFAKCSISTRTRVPKLQHLKSHLEPQNQLYIVSLHYQGVVDWTV